MSTILITPPASEPVSLSEAKAHLKVETAVDDQLISNLIATARQQVEQQTGRLLMSQDWEIYLDEWPCSGEISLPLAPVQQVTTLKTFGADDVETIIDPAHYFVDMVSTTPRVLLREDRIWSPPGRIANAIGIAVTCGYGANAGDVPANLIQAMLLLIARWYDNRQPDCSSLATTCFAGDLQALLAPYQRVRL